MKQALRWTFSLLLLVLLGLVYVLTNNLFFMVSGSDSTSYLSVPSFPTQIVAMLVCAAALLAPARGGRRLGLWVVALAAALIGGHRLLIDNLHHRIRDVYLAMPLQTLTLDPKSEVGVTLKRGSFGLIIGEPGSAKVLRVFSPPVVGLDKGKLGPGTQ